MPNNYQNNGISVTFDTLGCAKNTVDTSKMQLSLLEHGFNIVKDINLCNCIIVNTCSFIEAAAQESIDTILEYKKFFPDKKIVVAGCLPSRYKKDLEKSLTEADAFLPCNKEDQLYELLLDIFHVNKSNYPKVQRTKNSRVIKNIKPYAYVKISDGCNRFCSYCMIPYIRGRYISSKYEEIANDIRREVCSGAKEIVLVAQDCGVWGSDFNDKRDLSWLLDKLAQDFKDIYFRCLYIQPDAITNKLIDTFCRHKNLINYFDIPLQHVQPHLLKSMNRSGSCDIFKKIIDMLRSNLSDVTLRTTLIAGYPGESEDDFFQLCNFLEDVQFDYVGAFAFSPEDGTKAAKLPNQISNQVKEKRLNHLRDISDRISLSKLDGKIGCSFDVVIEGYEDNRIYGRARFQAPEVDGVVYIDSTDTINVKPGDICNVKIIDSELYDLIGRVE